MCWPGWKVCFDVLEREGGRGMVMEIRFVGPFRWETVALGIAVWE